MFNLGRGWQSSVTSGLGVVSALLAASSPVAAQEEPGAAGLVSDLTRIIAIEESTGWFLDAQELDDVYPTLLESVCRATPEARRAALAWFAEESQKKGDPEALYQRNGGEMSKEVARALTLDRAHRALERAVERAPADCPFWIRPEPDFDGRQTDRNRFTLSLETGGLVQLRQTVDTWTFGGGGYGRLLPAYGFGGDITLLFGVEFGGGAMLRPRTDPTEFVINYFPALPLVARLHDVTWQYDFEVAPVALFQADDTRLSYGVRGGFALGIVALRTRGFLPWGGAHVAYEHYFDGARPSAHFVRGGLRVGIMWDP